MCAQYTLKSKASEIAKEFALRLPEELKNYEFDMRVQGFLKTQDAPVIRADAKGQLEIAMMKFSLCPSSADEFPFKWSTYNARMEREFKGRHEFIYQVATWKESFVKAQTCLVPLNAAVESSYFGLSAGKMIRFLNQDSGVFYAAGLWASWTDRTTGQIIESFTLITDDPYQFFFEHGHDRSIFIIDSKSYLDWLQNKDWSATERFDFLRKNRISLDWKVETERPMKDGWQKKAPSTKEISEIKVWRPA